MTTLTKIFSLTSLTLTVLFLTGCFSAQKALNNGKYDKAISKSIKKLKHQNKKDKHILILEEAYAEAIKLDLHKVDYWTNKDLVNNWKQVLNLYKKLDSRQNTVKRYLPLHIEQEGRDAQFTFKNYKENITVLKENVSEYLYRTANLLLEDENKIAARKAYEVLRELNHLKPGYKNTPTLKKEAFKRGQNHILIAIDNRYGAGLPFGFERDLTNLNINGKNSKWLVFHNNSFAGMQYDYVVEIDMKQVNVSPDRIDETVYTDRKKVRDGWQYELDKNGNVVKDSLGNDIKQPKFKWVTCEVIDSRQIKEASLSGMLHIYDNETRVLLDRIPVSGTSNFAHRFANANGNLNALSKESKTKIRKKAKPFPNDYQLLEDAIEAMKPAIEDAIEDRLELVMY